MFWGLARGRAGVLKCLMPKITKSERLNYNVTPHQHKFLRQAARLAGEPLALFVRKAAIDRAFAVTRPKTKAVV